MGRTVMAGVSAGEHLGASARTPGPRRAAGIYGTIITAAVLAAAGDHVPTLALAVSIVVTLVVYWLAEEYAELLGEQLEGGRLPTWADVAYCAWRGPAFRLAVSQCAGAGEPWRRTRVSRGSGGAAHLRWAAPVAGLASRSG